MIRIASVIVLLLSASSIPAQEREQQDRNYTVSVDVQLVQLPVSVVDRDGHPVNGLQKENFQVFEDGMLQEISLFKHEDIPLSVGLVIDNSGSMRNKRERVNSAALTFARESNPEDETFIVNFDDAAYLEQDYTSRIDDLVTALSHLDTRGETAIYDAVYLSAEHLNQAKRDKKALLLVTDGEDNKSQYSLQKVVTKLHESKVTVYAIGLLEDENARGGSLRKSYSRKAKETLEKFAQTTGGAAYFPRSVDEVEELCRRIARDLRNQYTLGYRPSKPKLDGSWHGITVRVNPPRNISKVSVRAKEGYYAPKIENSGGR